MRPSTHFTLVLATITFLGTLGSARKDTQGGQYKLTDDLSYKNFFDSFDFFSGPDPTKGFVQFQNMTSAVSQKLVGYLEDSQSIFLGVDFKDKDANGRASVRLESKKTWNEGLLIADIQHMPSSQCGLWPAFWLLGTGKEADSDKDVWPNSGEIDVLEGVNDYEHNAITLHTSTGCIVDNKTTPGPGTGEADKSEASFTGFLATDDCDVAAPDQDKNVGCSIKAPKTMPGLQTGSGADSKKAVLPSYGTEFNKAGGGVYAMEWTSSAISVWFFPRNSVAYATHFGNMTTESNSSPDPSTFGTPLAHFSGSGCDFTQRIRNQKIIFDTTFCGDWAGKEWDKSCAAKTGVDSCEAYVRDNPEAFKEAYWEVSGLKWFQRTAELEQTEKRDMTAPPPSFAKARGRQYRW